MRIAVRGAVADSHVSAIATVILLVWSFEQALQAVFLVVEKTIFDILTFSDVGHVTERLSLIVVFTRIFTAISSYAAAWLLSYWVYREAPFRSLTRYRNRVQRRANA